MNDPVATKYRTLRRLSHLIFEVLSLLFTILLLFWYSQTLQTVIEQIDPPQVVAVTEDYVDVRWHNRRRLDCPTEGTPSFFSPYATEFVLPSRPVAAQLDEQTFIRRYHFPEHFIAMHEAYERADPAPTEHLEELRLHIIARCNPLWPTQQLIHVPFKMVHQP